MISKASFQNIKRLFQAHREDNDSLFHKAAEAIISDELAANRHSEAQELMHALGGAHKRDPRSENLSVLSRRRSRQSDVVTLAQSAPRIPPPILATSTDRKIARVVLEYRERDKLAAHGLRPRTKLFFWGPPGCGKTLTAHYISSRLELPIGTVQLSSLISSFLGETAAQLQQAFDLAEAQPMVLFLDEFDAVAKKRDDPQDIGELKRVLNSLLQAIDSFRSTASLVIAATNHHQLIDRALWRRFDDRIHFGLPANQQRLIQLKRLLSGVKVKGSLEPVSRDAGGLSFAEIERALIDAIKTMLLSDKSAISTTDLRKALKEVRFDARGGARAPKVRK